MVLQISFYGRIKCQASSLYITIGTVTGTLMPIDRSDRSLRELRLILGQSWFDR